jgi:hypothetical protein
VRHLPLHPSDQTIGNIIQYPGKKVSDLQNIEKKSGTFTRFLKIFFSTVIPSIKSHPKKDSNPTDARSSVVFPDPLSPKSATLSCCCIQKLTFSTVLIELPEYRIDTDLNSSAGVIKYLLKKGKLIASIQTAQK